MVHSLELTGLVGDEASPIHRLDPRAKIVGLLGVTVAAVSAPLAAWPVFTVSAALLAWVAIVAGVSPGVIWRRSRVVLPLVVFVAAFAPFVREGGASVELGPVSVSEAGLAVLAAVAVKATIGTVAAVLLGATTSFPALLRGLEALRVPRTLTLIAGFMYRYLFVIADEVRRMRAALAARGYRARTAVHAAAIGRVVSALFLRAYGRGERVYLAMTARGYRGSMPETTTLAFGRAEAAFVAVIGLAIVPVRLLAEAAA